MWSGPRTVSTALMRSFENRPDTVVVDEPLYGFYLATADVDHPGQDEIIASMPTDWRAVLADLARAPLPAGISVFYQKHMTHHLLPEVDRAAFAGLRHAFLIRDPRQLLASYARVRSAPVLADLGLPQQAEIFAAFGGPVIDSADILRDPRAALEALCDALGIAFDPAMLSWPAGPAGQRRRVGALLVRERLAIDRVRPGTAAACRGSAAGTGANWPRGASPTTRNWPPGGCASSGTRQAVRT